MTQETTKTILLVEDEDSQRQSLSLMFEAEGYIVISTPTAEHALESMDKTVPDLVITDVKLPGMDGFTFFDRIRTLPPLKDTPLIFITGFNDPKAIDEAKKLGSTGYVTKPYDLEDLLILVKKVLDGEEGQGRRT